MCPSFEKIKAHVKRRQAIYSFCGGIVIAGITCGIMKGRYADFLRSSDRTAMTVFVRPFAFLSKQTIVNVIHREGRGHPGYMVLCRETGDVFSSQAEAAAEIGTSAQNMSSHLNGRFSDVYGLHFERLSV